MTEVLHFSSDDNDPQTGALENFIRTETVSLLMTPAREGRLCGYCNGERSNYTLSLGEVLSAVIGVKQGHTPKARCGFGL